VLGPIVQTRRSASASPTERVGDLGQREAGSLGTLDPAKSGQVGFVVQPVSAEAPVGPAQQPAPLVVAHGLDADAGARGNLPDSQHVHETGGVPWLLRPGRLAAGLRAHVDCGHRSCLRSDRIEDSDVTLGDRDPHPLATGAGRRADREVEEGAALGFPARKVSHNRVMVGVDEQVELCCTGRSLRELSTQPQRNASPRR
jgi:hypothetical protein